MKALVNNEKVSKNWQGKDPEGFQSFVDLPNEDRNMHRVLRRMSQTITIESKNTGRVVQTNKEEARNL